VTYEELIQEIKDFPGHPALGEPASGPGSATDDAAAIAELSVAANIARATQESLKMRVEVARGRGATWTMIGDAIGVTAWRAQQRYFEHRPFGARW
jgi:hypothetical protein